MSSWVNDGGLLAKDPSDSVVYEFEWDAHLDAAVGIATSTWTITAIRPSADTALTKDEPAIAGRTTQIRLTAGTVGAVYRLDNKIVTNETPTQTIERSVFIKVEQR